MLSSIYVLCAILWGSVFTFSVIELNIHSNVQDNRSVFLCFIGAVMHFCIIINISHSELLILDRFIVDISLPNSGACLEFSKRFPLESRSNCSSVYSRISPLEENQEFKGSNH